MRIAICGGTFDPFHHGHLEPILSVRENLGWDRVIYVPAWKQPFKADRATTSGFHRFAMVALGIRDRDDVYVSPIELERGGTSYTVDTLESFHQMFTDAELDWVIGDDNVAQFLEWKNPERLLELARFVVLTRGGATVPPSLEGRFTFAENSSVPISSTDIRQRVRDGRPIDAFVDPLVSRYIHHYGLYKEGHS
jgi:nicotinate-nucleotide adenylyltransferase